MSNGLDLFASVRSETRAIVANGSAPSVRVGLAVGGDLGAVAWGNAVVLAQREVGGNAGEVVTTVPHRRQESR
jgi:hypothetical protein